jgi:hypothetical protein
MNWSHAFDVANTVALLAWCSLAFFPRSATLLAWLRYGLVGMGSLVYFVVISLFFFTMKDGGFHSLEGVKRLFASDAVVFAGWLHYLVFDLFVGVWIVERGGRSGLHRALQAPILLATFVFGPVGLLGFYLVEVVRQRGGSRSVRQVVPSDHLL